MSFNSIMTNNITIREETVILGPVEIADDTPILLGDNNDISIKYDETTNNALEISANVEGQALGIVLKADQGADAADTWKLNIADGGTISLGNDINTKGTFVDHLTIVPHATDSSSITTVAGKLHVGGDLEVSGTTTTVNSTVVEVVDPIMTLGQNNGEAKDRGILFNYGSSNSDVKKGFMGYDKSENTFTFLTEATNTDEVMSGTLGNIVAGTLTGNVTGNVTGDVTGDLTGDVTGNLTGDVTGALTGNVTGNVTGALTGALTGDVTGDVTGALTGNVTGNVTGDVTGDLTGDVTGNLTGDEIGRAHV